MLAGYRAPAWVADLIEEAATFPNGRNDDQVDAFSQAINWAADKQTEIHMRISVTRARLPENLHARGYGGPSTYPSVIDRTMLSTYPYSGSASR